MPDPQVINNFSPDTKFQHNILKLAAAKTIRSEGFRCGHINIVLSDKQQMLELNQNFLKHTHDTDVITFRLNQGNIVDGEIYVGIEQANIQAKEYKVTLENELARLVIHGSLHLCGYLDEKPAAKKKMTLLEDKYLTLFGKL